MAGFLSISGPGRVVQPFNCNRLPSVHPSTVVIQRKLIVSSSSERHLFVHDNLCKFLHVGGTSLISPLNKRFNRLPASDSHVRQGEGSDSFQEWDVMTAKFSAASTVPFLLLQLPQIILNARNLMAGNKTALFAVPWLGMLTGLLGNLSLLSYFAKKKEVEAVTVQTLGVISTYIVLVQLAMAEAMPLPIFTIVSVVVASGLLLNFLSFFGWLSPVLWRAWEDFTTIGGLSVLPQVMWSTFVPFVPNTFLPGGVSFIIAVTAVTLARTNKLSKKGVEFIGAISGWTATLLFMWMAVAQMWTNFLNPENIKGLSSFTMLLGLLGNGLMIPRSLLVRDLMWFTGSIWGSLFYGWGNLLSLYCFNCISKEFFAAATAGTCLWIGYSFWKDTKVYGHGSPLTSLKELVCGR